jgi:hypothetical protein
VTAAQTCIECGDELLAERARLGYQYCTKTECQRRHHRGLLVTTYGVNKSADAVVVADPEEIRRRGEAGEFGRKDSTLGLDHPVRAPAPATPRRTPGPPRVPAPRTAQGWTVQQEKIVRLYHEMGLSPRQIAERARDTVPRLRVTERLVIQILSAPRPR